MQVLHGRVMTILGVPLEPDVVGPGLVTTYRAVLLIGLALF